jgi:hypothetical protein
VPPVPAPPVVLLPPVLLAVAPPVPPVALPPVPLALLAVPSPSELSDEHESDTEKSDMHSSVM